MVRCDCEPGDLECFSRWQADEYGEELYDPVDLCIESCDTPECIDECLGR